MSFTTAITRLSYNGDGASVNFTVPWLFYANTDLLVIVGGVTQVLGAQFNATGAALGSGTVTFVTAPPIGVGNIQIILNDPLTQLANFVDGTAFPANTLNQVNDRSVQISARLYDMITRCLRVPDGDAAPNMLLPSAAQRSNNGLGGLIQTYDAVGNPSLVSVLAAGITLSAAAIGGFLYPILGTEVGVVNIYWPYGDWRRYGSDPTGVADSTNAINNANASWFASYGIAGTYKCSAPITMRSGQTMYGDGAATVLSYADGSINNVVMQSISSATARDFKIAVTGVNGTTKLGAIYLSQSTGCHIERVEMSGYNWSGIWMDQANNCFIRDNRCYGAPSLLNTTANGGDINLWSNSSTAASNYNVIQGNQCFGVNTAFGIMLIDPDAATATTGYPLRNTVSGNRVGAHTTYGIALYMPGAGTTAADTFNQIVNNHVENITGLSFTGFPGLPNTSSGAGIYAVGKGIGGTVITGNTVTNCCINTLIRNLAPAGIGVNGVQTGITRPVVANNTINGMTQGDGVLVTSSPGGAVLGGNSINMPSSNIGTGPGFAALTGSGIRIEASSNVTLGPNDVQVYGLGQALFIYANGIAINNVDATGGVYSQNYSGASTAGPSVFVTQNGGFNPQHVTLTGVRAIASNATVANDAFSVNSAIVCTLSGCDGNSSIGRGLLVNTSTVTRVSGGSYTTASGAAAVATSGACTSGFLDESVYTGNSAALINNAGTGFTIKIRLAAVPAAGVWAVGDTVFNSAPSAAGVFLWVTTTAGAGTWKTVSNT